MKPAELNNMARIMYNTYYGKNLDKREYSATAKHIGYILSKYLMDGNVLTLPFRLGGLYVIDIPSKKQRIIDYGATKRLRKQINPNFTMKDWANIPYEKRPCIYKTDTTVHRFTWKRYRQISKSMVSNYKFVATTANIKRVYKHVRDTGTTYVNE